MATTAETSAILIVGSGPAGLATALVLRQNGVQVRIIEKKDEYPVGQRGAGIQPRTLELHYQLGTLDDVLAKSTAPQLMKWYAPPPNGDQEVKRMNPFVTKPATPAIPYPNGTMLGQSAHEAVFRKHLAQLDCHVELATELRSFEQFEDHVVANIVKCDKNGQETLEVAKFRWLIGADGARGVVRKGLGLSFLGETIAMDMVLGDVKITNPGALTTDWLNWRYGDPSDPASFTAVVTLRPATGEGEGIWNFLVAGSVADPLLQDLTRENFIKAFHAATGLTNVEFGDLVWMGKWKPNIRMVNKFSEGRVFVAGDAAHVHSPNGGQGMNSGVQDAINLAWKLAVVERGWAPATILTTYNSERLPVIAEMLDMTSTLFKHVVKGDEDKAWQRTEKHTMLGVNYRTSDIVLDERHARVPDATTSSYAAPSDGMIRAGDRAPDAPGLVRQNSQEIRLFDIFKPYHHSVLIFSSTQDAQPVKQIIQRYPAEAILPVVILPSGSTATDDSAVVDRDGYAAQAFNIEKGADLFVVVVRPDSYIGAIATSVEGVQKYLTRVFL